MAQTDPFPSLSKEEFPDGSTGGYAFTYRNVQRNADTHIETLYLNLILAIRQINELKGKITRLDPHTTYLPDEGLTYTDSEFETAIQFANENKFDIRIHGVELDGATRAWISTTNPQDGYRVFEKNVLTLPVQPIEVEYPEFQISYEDSLVRNMLYTWNSAVEMYFVTHSDTDLTGWVSKKDVQRIIREDIGA